MNFPWQPFLGGFGQTQLTPQQFTSFNPVVSPGTSLTAPSFADDIQSQYGSHVASPLAPPPVGNLPNDEEILVNALCAGQRKGSSCDHALNQIHTVTRLSLSCVKA